MTTLPVSDVAFDPYDWDFQDDPYPTYAELRAKSPLHYCAQHDVWALSRHADIEQALRVEGTYSNAMGVSIDASAWGPNAHKVMSFLAMDPPQQTRLRKLVSRGFTPRRVNELAPSIQKLTDDYFDEMLHGEFDWIHDFAGLLPMDVISEMIGVPPADRRELRRLADLVVHREDGVHDVPAEGMAAALDLIVYYADMVKQRQAKPTEDLTSALLAAEIDGDKLTDDEVIGFLFLMVVAGNETTTKLLGNSVFHLAANPEQQAQVMADEALVSQWMEETLRYDTSSQMIARHLLNDVSLHGVTAPAGSKLILMLGSANRDEDVFTDPGTYNVHRDKAELARHISFGGGRHFCLGANLARLETRIALEEFRRRVSHYEIDVAGAERVHSVNVRGFSALPMKVTAR